MSPGGPAIARSAICRLRPSGTLRIPRGQATFRRKRQPFRGGTIHDERAIVVAQPPQEVQGGYVHFRFAIKFKRFVVVARSFKGAGCGFRVVELISIDNGGVTHFSRSAMILASSSVS